MATRKKRMTKKQKRDKTIVKLVCVICILISIITMIPNMGVLGLFLYRCSYYLFGDVLYLFHLGIIIISLIIVQDKAINSRYFLAASLVFLAVLLIVNTTTVDLNNKAMDVLSAYFTNFKAVFTNKVSLGKGGLIGCLLYAIIYSLFNIRGVIVISCALIFIPFFLLKPEFTNFMRSIKVENPTPVIKKQPAKTTSKQTTYKQPSIFEVLADKPENTKSKEKVVKEKPIKKQPVEEQYEETPIVSKASSNANVVENEKHVEQFVDNTTQYQLPRIQHLDTIATNKQNINRQIANEKGKILIQTLEQFDLPSRLNDISIGPQVTQFEIVPTENFNIKKYATIKETLSMALQVSELRIQVPIPGKGAVGIEIPNEQPTMVRLRELLSDVPDKYGNEPLMMALGRDITGNKVYGLINKMPHLLIAGATGSGKSVCINSIILTLLLRCRPDDVKLLMIDPKKVEFTPYEKIPHLIAPIINDTDKAAVALKKLVQIMEERYDIFSHNGARSISEYNKANPTKKMYSIVCIIDELADLMATHGKDVELYIHRLASMARAAGIYMILATQRPSVDVITGTIKSNIVSRIAFAVNSGVDSKTILDQTGAEDLLGNGDMLYNPQGASNPIRVQGVYVSDEEVKRVVSYFEKNNYVPHYADIFVLDDQEETNAGSFNPGQCNDPLYKEVEKWAMTQKTLSITAIQRRFGLGFGRAAKIIDALEANAIVSGGQGSKPRIVIKRVESNEE